MTFSSIKDVFTGGVNGALIPAIIKVFNSYEEMGLTVDEAIDRYAEAVKNLDK
jgi:hypothetical protein